MSKDKTVTLWESWYASARVCVLESVRVSACVCVCMNACVHLSLKEQLGRWWRADIILGMPNTGKNIPHQNNCVNV